MFGASNMSYVPYGRTTAVPFLACNNASKCIAQHCRIAEGPDMLKGHMLQLSRSLQQHA